jgi:hypothetical protein
MQTNVYGLAPKMTDTSMVKTDIKMSFLNNLIIGIHIALLFSARTQWMGLRSRTGMYLAQKELK